MQTGKTELQSAMKSPRITADLQTCSVGNGCFERWSQKYYARLNSLSSSNPIRLYLLPGSDNMTPTSPANGLGRPGNPTHQRASERGLHRTPPLLASPDSTFPWPGSTSRSPGQHWQLSGPQRPTLLGTGILSLISRALCTRSLCKRVSSVQ